MNENESHIGIEGKTNSQEPLFPLDFTKQEEVENVWDTLRSLSFLKDHLPSEALILRTDNKNYGWIASPEKDSLALTRFNVVKPDQFPAILVYADEFYKSRTDLMSLTETSSVILTPNGDFVVLEKKGEDNELLKRKRILEENGLVTPEITQNDSYTIWHAKKKQAEKAHATKPEHLELSPQRSPRIPEQVRTHELIKTIPEGDIAYIFADSPNQAILIDRKTWKPLMQRTGTTSQMKSYSIPENGGRRFAAVIIESPPLNPDSDNFQDIFHRAAEIVKNDIEKDERGRILDQGNGALLIWEPKDEDSRKGWRIKMLKNSVKKTKKKFGREREVNIITNISVDNSGEVVVTAGRLGRERGKTSLFEGKNGSYYKMQLESLPFRYSRLGYDIDTSALESECEATGFLPRTINNLKDGNNCDFTYKKCGECTWHRDINGITSKIHACSDPDHEVLPDPPPLPDEVKITSEILEDVRCPNCGSMARQSTYFTGYDKQSDEVGLHVETFCPKENCDQGMLANETRTIPTTQYITRYKETTSEYSYEPNVFEEEKNDHEKKHPSAEIKQKKEHQPGDVITLEATCGCGENFKGNVYREGNGPIKIEIYCPHDGYVKTDLAFKY